MPTGFCLGVAIDIATLFPHGLERPTEKPNPSPSAGSDGKSAWRFPRAINLASEQPAIFPPVSYLLFFSELAVNEGHVISRRP